MNETLSITAILALVVNLMAVAHYGARLRRDLIEQIKADEKRWSEHETRIVVLERAFGSSSTALNTRLESMEGRLEQTNESLLSLLAELLEQRGGRTGGTRKQ